MVIMMSILTGLAVWVTVCSAYLWSMEAAREQAWKRIARRFGMEED